MKHEYFRSEEELPLNINQAVASITGSRSEMSDIQGCCPGHVRDYSSHVDSWRGKPVHVCVVNTIRHRCETQYERGTDPDGGRAPRRQKLSYVHIKTKSDDDTLKIMVIFTEIASQFHK